jgi:hypothetical protein
MAPDSSKGTTDKLCESFTATTDKVALEFQSDLSESTIQSIGNKLGREKDDRVHSGTGDGILDETNHALGMDQQ